VTIPVEPTLVIPVQSALPKSGFVTKSTLQKTRYYAKKNITMLQIRHIMQLIAQSQSKRSISNILYSNRHPIMAHPTYTLLYTLMLPVFIIMSHHSGSFGGLFISKGCRVFVRTSFIRLKSRDLVNIF